MPHLQALPFFLKRSDGIISGGEITSTQETIHGLLLLDEDRLIIQWRTARQTDRVGQEIRTDRELDPLREVSIPLEGVASAEVRSPWWKFGEATTLVLTAADLRAFEQLTGDAGLRLDHPAELVLRIRKADRPSAREFTSELELAHAERALRIATSDDNPTLKSS